MTTRHWIVIAWLVLAALVMFIRGVVGQTRTYDGWDAFGAVVETGILIWLVSTL